MQIVNQLKELKFDEEGNARIKVESVTGTRYSIDDVVVEIRPVGPPVLGRRVHNLHSKLWEISDIPENAHAYCINNNPGEWIHGKRQVEIESDETRPDEEPLYKPNYYRPIQLYEIVGRKEN